MQFRGAEPALARKLSCLRGGSHTSPVPAAPFCQSIGYAGAVSRAASLPVHPRRRDRNPSPVPPPLAQYLSRVDSDGRGMRCAILEGDAPSSPCPRNWATTGRRPPISAVDDPEPRGTLEKIPGLRSKLPGITHLCVPKLPAEEDRVTQRFIVGDPGPVACPGRMRWQQKLPIGACPRPCLALVSAAARSAKELRPYSKFDR